MRRGEEVEPTVLQCNGCWAACDTKDHSVVTACQHLYCLNCCQTILESDDPTCPICTQLIQKNNIKAVHVLASASNLRQANWGATPAVALEVAHSAIQFYNKQQKLYAEYAQQQSQRKIVRTQEQCRKKLQEVHNGYLAAKRKYQEVLAQKHGLQNDNQELQDKYNQKAMQDKKLKETFAQLQRENEELRRKLGAGCGGAGGGGSGGMGAHLAGAHLAGGPSGGGGRASRMAGMGVGMGLGLEDAGMGRRPPSAVAVRAPAPDPSPLSSMHLGAAGGFGGGSGGGYGGGSGGFVYDTPDHQPPLRAALNSGGGGGHRISGSGMGGSAQLGLPGLGGGGHMGGGQGLQNSKRQAMGLQAFSGPHSMATM